MENHQNHRLRYYNFLILDDLGGTPILGNHLKPQIKIDQRHGCFFFNACYMSWRKKRILPAFRLGGSGFRGWYFWEIYIVIVGCSCGRWYHVHVQAIDGWWNIMPELAIQSIAVQYCGKWTWTFSVSNVSTFLLMSVCWWNMVKSHWNPIIFENYPIILYPNWYHDPIVFNINPIILLLQKWWDPLKYGIPNGSPWILLFKKWWDPHWIPKIFVEFLWSTLRDLRDLRLEELGDQDFKARPGRS